VSGLGRGALFYLDRGGRRRGLSRLRLSFGPRCKSEVTLDSIEPGKLAA
jgi:hypothetical protein